MGKGEGLLAAVYEDRPSHLVGVAVLVASLEAHSPGLRVSVCAPGAPGWFARWMGERPAAEVAEVALAHSGWDVKPSLLLHHLAQGERGVVWLDSDLVATGDVAARLAAVASGRLVTTEDLWWGRRQGGSERTEAWGLPVGEPLPATANTAVVRVGPEHRDLLEEWDRLLRRPDYRAAQALPWGERPLAMVGDQDVLTALLGSAPWAGLRPELLRRGRDIVQSYGPGAWSVGERLAVARGAGPPVLVHAMGPKPWEPAPSIPSALGRALDRRHRRSGPYVTSAEAYRQVVPGGLPWPTPLGGASAIERAARRQVPAAAVDGALIAARAVSGRVRSGLGRRVGAGG